jgi:hypothetical protein
MNAVAERSSRLDPALAGRELGEWTMVPPSLTVPLALLAVAALAWYFARLGRPEVPTARRWIRRVSAAILAAATIPLVRALSFVHPHEDRAGWALAWSVVLLATVVCALLAIVDLAMTARGGLREYRALRRETFGGGRRPRG